VSGSLPTLLLPSFSSTHSPSHHNPIRYVAAKCEDLAQQNQVIVAASQTGSTSRAGHHSMQSTSGCIEMLAPCIDSLPGETDKSTQDSSQVRTMLAYISCNMLSHLPYMKVSKHTCHINIAYSYM